MSAILSYFHLGLSFRSTSRHRTPSKNSDPFMKLVNRRLLLRSSEVHQEGVSERDVLGLLDLLEDHRLAERTRAVEVFETRVREVLLVGLRRKGLVHFLQVGAAEGSTVKAAYLSISSRLSMGPDTVSLYFSTNDLMECFWRWLPSLTAYNSAKKASIFSEAMK
jgi:hypothetical protein